VNANRREVVMVIQFEVGSDPAEFEFKQGTGAAELRVGTDTIKLQSGMNPRSWASAHTTQTWTCEAAGHAVAIVKVRPRWFAGFRESAYRVSVDDAVVAQAQGR
jgi:hypothetical protein